MKSKLDMAHEYMQNTLNLLRKHNVPYDLESLIGESFEYADAMYSAFESKEDKSRPDVLQDVVWLPDWSEAPVWAIWWAMDEDGCCYWFEDEPDMKSLTWMPTGVSDVAKAHSFNYQGTWVDSLRKRPQHY